MDWWPFSNMVFHHIHSYSIFWEIWRRNMCHVKTRLLNIILKAKLRQRNPPHKFDKTAMWAVEVYSLYTSVSIISRAHSMTKKRLDTVGSRLVSTTTQANCQLGSTLSNADFQKRKSPWHVFNRVAISKDCLSLGVKKLQHSDRSNTWISTSKSGTRRAMTWCTKNHGRYPLQGSPSKNCPLVCRIHHVSM